MSFNKAALILFLVWNLSLFAATATIRSVNSTGCGVSKTCFRLPTTCNDHKDCEFLLSWKPVLDNGVSYLEIEAIGNIRATDGTPSTSGYVAIGFNALKQMPDAGVVGCMVSPLGVVSIRSGHNIKSGYLNTFVNGSSDFLQTSGPGNTNLLGAFYNAALKTVVCRFRRRILPKVNIALLKDLSPPKQYYVLSSRASNVDSVGFTHHNIQNGKAISDKPFQVGKNQFSNVMVRAELLVKVHGVLMMVAWLLCANIGIIMARYMKNMWHNKTLVSQKVWFTMHRSIQMVCVILTAAAFVIIFVHNKGYSHLARLPDKAHPILGIIVMGLALLNPFIALFRPAPDSPRRPIFNWIHFFIGSLAQIASVSTMFIGIRMEDSGANFTALPYPFWILVGYVVFIVIMEAIFSVDYHCMNKKKTTDQIVMSDVSSPTGIQGEQSPERSNEYMFGQGVKDNIILPANEGRRLFLLCIHCIGVTGCTTALVVLLILN